MGTRIIYNDQTLVFKCDKKKGCKSSQLCGVFCQHTTEIEHAVFDGEKEFESRGPEYLEEK